ncbi:hypothetical protein BKA93DRAFT_506039 [Sparassis latifolia]
MYSRSSVTVQFVNHSIRKSWHIQSEIEHAAGPRPVCPDRQSGSSGSYQEQSFPRCGSGSPSVKFATCSLLGSRTHADGVSWVRNLCIILLQAAKREFSARGHAHTSEYSFNVVTTLTPRSSGLTAKFSRTRWELERMCACSSKLKSNLTQVISTYSAKCTST